MTWGTTHFNTFSAVSVNGKLAVSPGDGKRTWEDVQSFQVHRLTKNSLQFADGKALQESLEFWSAAQPVQLLITVAETRWLNPYIFGTYGYREGESPDREIERILKEEGADYFCSRLGIKAADFEAKCSKWSTDESAVLTGVTEMRIVQLHERSGFPRTTTPLGKRAALVEEHQAIEDNWDAMCSLALMPGIDDETREEAAYLAHRISLLRLDLVDRTKARKIPATSNPDLAQN